MQLTYDPHQNSVTNTDGVHLRPTSLAEPEVG
jgi:hypothetical protein